MPERLKNDPIFEGRISFFRKIDITGSKNSVLFIKLLLK